MDDYDSNNSLENLIEDYNELLKKIKNYEKDRKKYGDISIKIILQENERLKNKTKHFFDSI